MKQKEVVKTVVQTALVVAGGIGAGYLYRKLAGDAQSAPYAPWLIAAGGIGLAVIANRKPLIHNLGMGVAVAGGTVLVQRMLNTPYAESPVSGMGAYYTDNIEDSANTPLLLPDLGEPLGNPVRRLEEESTEQYL
ncbi:MAG: hypothetical protein KF690_11020 [Bacteroidetes bacterium]|nr:hypothetical protein [Bacteroidota bacterium]